MHQTRHGIPDTGATSTHCIQQCDLPASYTHAKPLQPNEGPQAIAADGGSIQATHYVQVPLTSQLSAKKVQVGHIMHPLTTVSLISVDHLCNDDCIAIPFHDTMYKS